VTEDIVNPGRGGRPVGRKRGASSVALVSRGRKGGRQSRVDCTSTDVVQKVCLLMTITNVCSPGGKEICSRS
jgi:hypothetical protein